MLSTDAKATILFTLGGAVSGAIGSRLPFVADAAVGIALMYGIRRYVQKKYPDVDIGQVGILPFLATWVAVLIFLANI